MEGDLTWEFVMMEKIGEIQIRFKNVDLHYMKIKVIHEIRRKSNSILEFSIEFFLLVSIFSLEAWKLLVKVVSSLL